MTAEEIAAHNASVYAFRAEHYPRLEAMTDEECRSVYARWTSPHEVTSAKRIAIEFRERLGGTWPTTYSAAIGIKMLHVTLERLDKYDPDFRPDPTPELLEEGLDGASVWYLPADGRCRVEYQGRSKEFRPCWNPRFGLDVGDRKQALEIIARLKSRNDGR